MKENSHGKDCGRSVRRNPRRRRRQADLRHRRRQPERADRRHPPPGQDRVGPCPARGGRRVRGRRRGASDRASSPSAPGAAGRAICTSSTACSIATARACRCSPSPRRSPRPRSAAAISRRRIRRRCSRNAATIASSSPAPTRCRASLEIAIREAVGKRGVSVVVIPGDVALQPASMRRRRRSAGCCRRRRSLRRRAARSRSPRRAAQRRAAASRSCAARDARARTTSCWRSASASRRRWCTRCAARSMSSGTTPTTSA